MRNHIKFEFYKCNGFNEKSDVTKAIMVMLSHGVTLEKHRKESGRPPQVLHYIGSVDEYVNEEYQEVELIDGDKVPVHLREGPNYLSGVGLIEKIKDSDKQQSLSFGFEMFGKKFNKVDGSVITSEDNIDAYARLFLEIASSIYPILRPAFGIVDYSGMTGGTIFKEVLACKTKTIYWSTFFGPNFVNKYGREYFLNAPTWKKSELSDGGVLIQLNENLKNPRDFVALDEVKKYFSAIGVGNISWPNKNLYKW